MTRLGKTQIGGEEGSAMTEAAILIPILILIMYWSSAMTDVMVLKIKAQEAARFALWEMTVFRSPTDISADVQTRFADMKSGLKTHSANTGLLMYPQSSQISWKATIDPNYEVVNMNGQIHLPTTGQGFIDDAANTILNAFVSTVNGAVHRQQFNTSGSASATVSLTHSSHAGSIIMNGGDFAGHPNGGQDLAATNTLSNFMFETPFASERPMRLVYDSWKAWPKPAAYTKTHQTPASLMDPSISPSNTYPVVESMVSNQVNKIAFFGMGQVGFINSINHVMDAILSSGFTQAVLGGNLPNIFSTDPMDHKLGDVASGEHTGNVNFSRGPITILPVSQPDAAFVPGGGLMSNRLGDKGTSTTSVFTADDYSDMGAGSDNSRYTVPYRINTKYWTNDGGTKGTTFGAMVAPPPASQTTNNKYVAAYACRGHYFAGGATAQVADPHSRYHLLGNCTY